MGDAPSMYRYSVFSATVIEKKIAFSLLHICDSFMESPFVLDVLNFLNHFWNLSFAFYNIFFFFF